MNIVVMDFAIFWNVAQLVIVRKATSLCCDWWLF